MNLSQMDIDLYLCPLPELGKTMSGEEAMLLTVQLATRGSGFNRTNPLVGCVILSGQGVLLGYGWHEGFGGHHAEVLAVQMVREIYGETAFEQAVLYTSLEPCCHHGKTPPCTDLILSLPVAKVVYGDLDPNPKVSGHGVCLLEGKGVVVESPDLYRRLTRQMIAPFFTNQNKGRAHLVLKAASSVDGVIGCLNQQKFEITPRNLQLRCHWLRQKAEMIAIGSRTAVVDNPLLNVRWPEIRQAKQPDILLLDSSASALEFYLGSGSCPNWLFEGRKCYWVLDRVKSRQVFQSTAFKAWQSVVQDKVEFVLDLPYAAGKVVCWESLAQWAYLKHKVATILLEGGACLWDQALSQQVVDEVHLIENNTRFVSKFDSSERLVMWPGKNSPDWSLLEVEFAPCESGFSWKRGFLKYSYS